MTSASRPCGGDGHDGATPAQRAPHRLSDIVVAADAAHFGDTRVVGSPARPARLPTRPDSPRRSRQHVSTDPQTVHHDMRRPGRLRAARFLNVGVLENGRLKPEPTPRVLARRPGPCGHRERLVQHRVRRQRANRRAGFELLVELLELSTRSRSFECPTSRLPITCRRGCTAPRPMPQTKTRTGGEHLVKEARRCALINFPGCSSAR